MRQRSGIAGAFREAQPPGFEAGTRICAFRDLFKSFPLVEAQRPHIVLIDIQSEAAPENAGAPRSKETRNAASFGVRRDRELIEIGGRRIEGRKAKQPARAVKAQTVTAPAASSLRK